MQKGRNAESVEDLCGGGGAVPKSRSGVEGVSQIACWDNFSLKVGKKYRSNIFEKRTMDFNITVQIDGAKQGHALLTASLQQSPNNVRYSDRPMNIWWIIHV